MLVLSRKNQQSIKIGDIVITVVSTRNGRAKIGITAPENVRIRRAETIDCEAEQSEELVGQC